MSNSAEDNFIVFSRSHKQMAFKELTKSRKLTCSVYFTTVRPHCNRRSVNLPLFCVPRNILTSRQIAQQSLSPSLVLLLLFGFLFCILTSQPACCSIFIISLPSHLCLNPCRLLSDYLLVPAFTTACHLVHWLQKHWMGGSMDTVMKEAHWRGKWLRNIF